MTVTWPKMEIFKIQDGGSHHLENRFFGHNSSTDCPISAKFCVRKQNGMATRATWKNCKFFKSKMADGRHFENCLIAISQSKIVRFWWNLVHYIRYWTRLQLKFLKFKMAAAAILKIPFLAITHRLISVQFCMRKQNGMSTRAKWQNLQIFKIQDGRRPPFWKSLNCHISVKNRPILIKFDTLHQILNPITVTWPKIEIFEI